MEKPRTEKMIDLFNEHPKGITMDQFVKILKAKSKKDIGNTIQLLKHKGHEIVNYKGYYRLVNKNTLQIKRTVLDDITDELSKYPDGITPNDLAKACKIKQNNLANRIFCLRKKGFNIVFKDDKYYLNSGSLKSASPKEQELTMNSKSLIPKKYQNTFLNLSDSDKADCIDMLRKSLYYQKSAFSLLESNMEVLSFISSIGGSYNAEKN